VCWMMTTRRWAEIAPVGLRASGNQLNLLGSGKARFVAMWLFL
jgi:hypothetical protein